MERLTAADVAALARRAGVPLAPARTGELARLLEHLLEAAERLPEADPAEAGGLGDPYDATTGGAP